MDTCGVTYWNGNMVAWMQPLLPLLYPNVTHLILPETQQETYGTPNPPKLAMCNIYLTGSNFR